MMTQLAVATAELSIRLDRLKRQTERPVPPTHVPAVTVLDRYDTFIRRLRAERGQS